MPFDSMKSLFNDHFWTLVPLSLSTIATAIIIMKSIWLGMEKLMKTTFQTQDGCKEQAIKCVRENIRPITVCVAAIKTQLNGMEKTRNGDRFEAMTARKIMEDKLSLEIKTNREMVDKHLGELHSSISNLDGKLDILIKGMIRGVQLGE